MKYRLKSGLGVPVSRVWTTKILRANGQVQEMTHFYYEGSDEVRTVATTTFEWLYEPIES